MAEEREKSKEGGAICGGGVHEVGERLPLSARLHDNGFGACWISKNGRAVWHYAGGGWPPPPAPTVRFAEAMAKKTPIRDRWRIHFAWPFFCGVYQRQGPSRWELIEWSNGLGMSSNNVFEALIDDLEGRDAIGWAQNRRPLLANEPGRDWLTDAYEEALDQAVYLKGALMSRALTPGPSPATGEGSVVGEVATVFVGFALVVLSFAAGYLVGGGF